MSCHACPFIDMVHIVQMSVSLHSTLVFADNICMLVNTIREQQYLGACVSNVRALFTRTESRVFFVYAVQFFRCHVACLEEQVGRECVGGGIFFCAAVCVCV